MKALPISIILFLLLIFTIITNAIFINKTADEINDLASSVPFSENKKDTINKINTVWEERRPFLAFSITTDILDNITSTIICLNEAYNSSNESEIKKYSALLSDQTHTIRRAEAITIESIL